MWNLLLGGIKTPYLSGVRKGYRIAKGPSRDYLTDVKNPWEEILTRQMDIMSSLGWLES